MRCSAVAHLTAGAGTRFSWRRPLPFASYVLPPTPDSDHPIRWERLVGTPDSLLDSKPAITNDTVLMQKSRGRRPLKPWITASMELLRVFKDHERSLGRIRILLGHPKAASKPIPSESGTKKSRPATIWRAAGRLEHHTSNTNNQRILTTSLELTVPHSPKMMEFKDGENINTCQSTVRRMLLCQCVYVCIYIYIYIHTSSLVTVIVRLLICTRDSATIAVLSQRPIATPSTAP